MEERIMTMHPEGKSGVNISKQNYNLVRQAIIEVLTERSALTFTDLGQAVSTKLEGHFEGSMSWYYTTVKLDLEARGVIERLPGASPQQLRLAEPFE